MNMLCSNFHGVGNAATIHELAKKFAPTILYIIDTQINRVRVEALVGTLGYDITYAIDSQGRSGGIGILWNNLVKIEILGYWFIMFIALCVLDPGEEAWRLSCVYREAQMHLRPQNLGCVKRHKTSSTLPWLCIGDFNEVLHPDAHECIGERGDAYTRF